MRTKIPIEERFWAKVSKGIAPNDCWIWIGAVLKSGYGVLSNSDWRSQIRAHRLSYQLHCGAIPDGMFVCHTCDNPRCVNPAHLWLGFQKDNIRDCMSKNRNFDVSRLSSAKTHCPQGHPYDAENTSYKGNERRCKACGREYMRRKRSRH